MSIVKFKKFCKIKRIFFVSTIFVILVCIQLLEGYLVNQLAMQNKLLFVYNKRKKDSMQIQQNINKVMNNTKVSSCGKYRIMYNMLGTIGDTIPKDSMVSLTTHSTVSHFLNIVELQKRWHGPIELVMFAPGKWLDLALLLIYKYIQCYRHIKDYITIHLVTNFPNDIESFDVLSDIYLCDKNIESKSRHQFVNITQKNYEGEGFEYPNNLLRNVAIQASKTQYVLPVDIDLQLSGDLYEKLNNLLHQDDQVQVEGKDVFVVPSFEIEEDIQIPEEKEKLMDLWINKAQIRPFYDELCEKCQRQTNYALWKVLPRNSLLSVAYKVEWIDPWEPFFVGPRSMPMFDERFKQYGFNRISQACEIHVAGYSFSVLDNAFIVHKGLKTNSSFHANKNFEQEHNRILFRQFKQELKLKYPNSTRRCS